MSKILDKLNELAKSGCLVEVREIGQTFHAVKFALGNKRLAWVNSFPRDQHDTHVMVYDRAEILYNRDVSFLDARGSIVAYVAPIEEFQTEAADTREQHILWQASMKERKLRDEFERFSSEQLNPLSEQD